MLVQLITRIICRDRYDVPDSVKNCKILKKKTTEDIAINILQHSAVIQNVTLSCYFRQNMPDKEK